VRTAAQVALLQTLVMIYGSLARADPGYPKFAAGERSGASKPRTGRGQRAYSSP